VKYDTLYNIDENDNVRIWYMERDGDKYRTVSGIEDGVLVYSGWTVAKPKNVGKKNETTGAKQANLEIQSKYDKKLDQKYTTVRGDAARMNFTQPMLAVKFKDIKDQSIFNKENFSQPKLDGIRAVVTKGAIYSRTGKPITSCPHILEELAPIFDKNPDLVLDGELYNHIYKDDFNSISSLVTKKKSTDADFQKTKELVEYHVYDLVDHQGFLFKERLDKIFNSVFLYIPTLSCVKLVETRAVSGMESMNSCYSDYLENDYEGQMIRLNAPYEFKRTKSLIKRKEFFDEEYEVISLIEGEGNWSGYAKSVLCKTKNGTKFSAGIKGNQEYTRELLLGPLPKSCTVRSPNLTPDGKPRFGIAVAFFEGKREY
jgi:ATP-dependent DNA ligase